MLNCGSVFGRIVPNFLADKFGPLNVLVPCAALSGILTLCLLAVHNVGGIVVIALIFGFFSGSFVSLPATVFVHLTANRALIGTRMGQGFSIVSVAVLIGTPIAGLRPLSHARTRRGSSRARCLETGAWGSARPREGGKFLR